MAASRLTALFDVYFLVCVHVWAYACLAFGWLVGWLVRPFVRVIWLFSACFFLLLFANMFVLYVLISSLDGLIELVS